MEKDKVLKESWISAKMLCAPKIISNKLSKGVLILNQVDPVLKLHPGLKDLFYIVERYGWFGPNPATMADVVLLEDQSVAEDVKEISPNSIHLDIGPADFIDQDAFYPLGIRTEYDVIQISCWSRRKRIELLINAASKLPQLSFVHLGHFEDQGCEQELTYRAECLELARRIAPNLYFPFAHCDSNESFPNSKAEINCWINNSKIGVLTTTSEGINRFKMECLAANRPCLVPSDIAWTTKKHINSATGMIFDPNVDSLCMAIKECLGYPDRFSPRKYILDNTGKNNSLPKLKHALSIICKKDQSPYRYDHVDWDGRNESLQWGEDARRFLNNLLTEYQAELAFVHRDIKLGSKILVGA